jgi:hypothetical protein
VEYTQTKNRGQFFTGIMIIGIGILFLLRNVDVIEFPFHKLWPLIFVIIGFARLFSAQSWENRSDSIFWFFMGAAFFIGTNHIWGLSFHDTWPLILIGVGLGIIAKSIARQFRVRSMEEKNNG